MVMPMRPAGTDGWSETQLAEIVTRDCMIGVALPQPGRTADAPLPVHEARRPVQARAPDEPCGGRSADRAARFAAPEQGEDLGELAPRYGVTSPEPPWKVGLAATCECLAARTTLPSLERRHEEDRLGETLYRDVPAPEQQLLALAHIMLERRMLSEADLAERMAAVRARLESA